MRPIHCICMFLCLTTFSTRPAHAQRINPSSQHFTDVPGSPAPQQIVAFTNTGATPLTLNVSITGPFAIAVDKCEAGVRPGTHCNVWITYNAPAVGEHDTGFLTLNYGTGAATVALAGDGVQFIGTSLSFGDQKSRYRLGSEVSVIAAFFTDTDEGYKIPYGEEVDLSCVNGSETVNLVGSIGLSCHHPDRWGNCPRPVRGLAEFGFTPDQIGTWRCTASYSGDGFFGPTSSGIWEIEIRPRK